METLFDLIWNPEDKLGDAENIQAYIARNCVAICCGGGNSSTKCGSLDPTVGTCVAPPIFPH